MRGRLIVRLRPVASRVRAALALTVGTMLALAVHAQTIFPSAETLPANHLKFYVYFPEPMRPGVFLDYCTLLKGNGEPVFAPFRETELWSDDRRRLTLWLHPGRQKTGVNLNEEFGPVLEPAQGYTLRISSRWPTESGKPLGIEMEKRFRTSAPLSARIDPQQWQITEPEAGSRAPLVLRFGLALDHSLLVRCLRVRRGSGGLVHGEAHVAVGEAEWRFTPESPWTAGPHTVEIDVILEDLAGNSIARPFQVDLTAPAEPAVENPALIPFSPKR